MWWLHADEGTAVPHACSADCTRIVSGSWVCSHTGAVLGPAPRQRSGSSEPATPRRKGDSSPGAAERFVAAVQHMMRRLVSGERRVAVEGARAEKARTQATRAAQRSIAAEYARGVRPNLGNAMCVAWAQYERSTNAMDMSAHLDDATEKTVLRACEEFFRAHLAREPSLEVVENRPLPDSLALATLYFMRDGLPGVLPKNKFLHANLPELARLKNYGCRVAHYTHARRFVQAMLDDERAHHVGA